MVADNLHPRNPDLGRSSGPGDPLPPETPVSPGEAMRAAARQLRERGYGIVWLRPGEKIPRSKRWQLESREPGAYSPGDNLGLLCGALSGDLVCIDLDDERAIELADQYLPPTGMVEGRPGKPRSHRYYRVTGIPETMKSTAAKGIGGPWKKGFNRRSDRRRLIDFLGTGGLAVVPPSLHEKSGEYRCWYGPDGKPSDAPGEPAEVPMTDLWKAVSGLAAACGWAPKAEAAPLSSESTRGRRPGSGPVRAGEPGPWEDVSVAKRVRRCRAYLGHVPGAVNGSGGHDATFRVAKIIVNDFAVPEKKAWELLQEYNERCTPPWGLDELRHKLGSALAAPEDPDSPKGCKLAPEDASPAGPPPDDPDRLAAAFLKGHCWRFWKGQYWLYGGTCYTALELGDAEGIVWSFARDELNRTGGRKHRKVSGGLVRNVLGALKAQCRLPLKTTQPSWLCGRAGVDFLALGNGILDLQNLELLQHSPDWFSPVCLPYEYDPCARCPGWEAALALSLEGDAERIMLLQEWFGYQLVRDTSTQAFMVLAGEGGNGKSVVCAALEAMLGTDNVSHVPLEAFGQRFQLTSSLGKLANVCSEVGELDRTAEGLLKAFSGGDRQNYDRKGLPAVEAAPTARLTFATNNPPRFSDKSQGVWRRLLLLPFRVTVPKNLRVAGMHAVEWWERSGELPGLLNWALEGLARLKANRLRFTEPEACAEALAEHRRDSDPARDFLLEHYEAHDAGRVVTAEVYRHYQRWCEESGLTKPLTRRSFTLQIPRAFPKAKTTVAAYGSERHRSCLGVRPRPTPPPSLDPETAPQR